MKIRSESLFNFFEYILCLFIILDCNSVFSAAANKYFYLREIILFLLVFLIFITILLKKVEKNRVNKIVCILTIIFIFNISILFLQGYSIGFVLYFILGLELFFIYYSLYSKKNNLILSIFQKITNLMLIIAIISLFFYFFGSILKVINNTGVFYVTWGWNHAIKSYYNLYFETQFISLGRLNILRNTGIFTEAPMYSLNLIIAFIGEILNKKNKKKIFILIFTILTTFSTTGMILLIIIAFSLFLIKENKNIQVKVIKVILIPILVFISCFFILILLDNKKETLSYSIRIDDYISAFKAWKDHPIIGNGFRNTEAYKKYMLPGRNAGQSNSILVILSDGGILLFLVYLFPIIVSIRYAIREKNKEIFLSVIIIITLLLTTIFHYTFMSMSLIAMGISLLIQGGEKNEV